MNFSAVILAGGKSSRMGRDKAWLEAQGRPLIARQIELVRQLEPAELLISASSEADYTRLGCPVLRDVFAGQGPLAGIEAALGAMRSPRLLTLAVDLPRMTVATLRWVVASAAAGGAVPRIDGQLEPLVAVYPRTAHALLRESLQAGQNAASEFARRCATAGWVRWLDVPWERCGDFANCNSPADWAAQAAS